MNMKFYESTLNSGNTLKVEGYSKYSSNVLLQISRSDGEYIGIALRSQQIANLILQLQELYVKGLEQDRT